MLRASASKYDTTNDENKYDVTEKRTVSPGSRGKSAAGGNAGTGAGTRAGTRAPNPVKMPACSFEDLCLPLRSEMISYARKLTRHDHARAEDIVQTAYIKAFRAWAKWWPTIPEHVDRMARGWLFRIVCNTFMNEYNVEKFRRGCHAQLEAEMAIYTVPARCDENDDLDVGDEMYHALHALSEDFRVVVMLIDVEGMTNEETAQALNIPVGTVFSRLFRAHAQMRKSLRKDGMAPASVTHGLVRAAK